MEPIVIHPERIRAYGEEEAAGFCVVTNRAYLDRFRIAESARYPLRRIVPFDEGERFADVLATAIPEGVHILTILPDCLLHSVPPEVLGRRKLLIMACRSGRTDLDGVAHFLAAGEATDPAEEEAFASRFFALGQAAEYLTLVDPQYGTSARFDHLSDTYEWHEQLGVVDWGGQQVYPAGEVACFLVPLKVEILQPEERFTLSGRLALRGAPIVQSGPPSFLMEDQERIYRRLATFAEHAVLIDVEAGDVVGVEATDPTCRPAADMLAALFEVDSRFRRLYEVGFAFNRHVAAWPGNSAMNEVCGGPHGQLHVGLGMLPHTQYHLDIFCAGTRVLTPDHTVLFGGPPGMTRKRSAICPCMSY